MSSEATRLCSQRLSLRSSQPASQLTQPVLLNQCSPSSWYSTLLPPLIALGMAYISLVLAYRTVRSTILVVWWGIKWGAILGAGIALWAWWVGEGDAIQSQGQVPSSGWASWAANGGEYSTIVLQRRRGDGVGRGLITPPFPPRVAAAISAVRGTKR